MMMTNYMQLFILYSTYYGFSYNKSPYVVIKEGIFCMMMSAITFRGNDLFSGLYSPYFLSFCHSLHLQFWSFNGL